jgi:Brp/Blh family beta-carotene 15,15'-monooxygenase
MVVAFTALFIGGGLPHGAYDIALLKRAGAFSRFGLILATGVYVMIAVLMVMLWMSLPAAALILFLSVAAVHFGEDWQMLDEPLLRVAAGAAIIAAPTIGHQTEVSMLFVDMSDEHARIIAQVITAGAPVALLVTAVGIGMTWQHGNRQWAAAMALCLIMLLLLPPVAGFALFFVFLHSPKHLEPTRAILRDMGWQRWVATGASLSVAAVLGWWGLQWLAPPHLDRDITAQAFQFLASVAVPHLLLSHWLEKQLTRRDLARFGPRAAVSHST